MIKLFVFTLLFCLNLNNLSYSANNEKKVQENKNKKNQLITNEKTDDIPDWPQDDIESYKLLFDDGFSNVVNNIVNEGEQQDIFINQDNLNKIIKQYKRGNNDDITQLDVIEAEKQTIFDYQKDEDKIVGTYRTRVMAYLTIEQMLFADISDLMPHGYYINTMKKE